MFAIYRCNSAKPPRPAPLLRCDRDHGHPGPHRNGATTWEEVVPVPPELTDRDIEIRKWAVEKVFQWIDTFEDDEDDDEENVTVTPVVIVGWARVFEAYIKGES